MKVSIIGIDCATKANKIGLAKGEWEFNRLIIQDVEIKSSMREIAERVCMWAENSEKTLLAMDAPLGWPDGMREELYSHRAGRLISVEKDKIFKRETDRFVKKKIGQTPLEVGADKIARTSHAALELLERIRKATIADIPLNWTQVDVEGIQVIEVYPAVVLRTLCLDTKGYKGNKQREVEKRKNLVHNLLKHTELEDQVEFCQGVIDKMKENDNLLDSALCVMAGADFCWGKCFNPPETDKDIARREGWIWFKR